LLKSQTKDLKRCSNLSNLDMFLMKFVSLLFCVRLCGYISDSPN